MLELDCTRKKVGLDVTVFVYLRVINTQSNYHIYASLTRYF